MSGKIQIPTAAFDQHIIVLGKTRSGKSSAMRVLVEHLLNKEEPVTIVDPKGDWWGLKASADGKQAGYPIVIFGGEHGDVPLNARSGPSVAELVATGNRSAIIDLGGWMPGDRTQFWIDFASTYFRAHKGRHFLVIDEVHNLAPKGKILDPNAGKMLHWSNRLASEGLGKGISMIAASQRPQKVHNDFLTSCETLLAMRVIHKSDRDAVRDWIDACGDPEQGKEVLATLASLSRGEAWAYSPEYDFGPKRVQFPMFETYDSFKPQKRVDVKLKGWAEVDLADVTKKLEAAVKEAEATDPKKLQARIQDLQKQLRTAQAAPKENKPQDIKAITDRAVGAALPAFRKAIAERDRFIARLTKELLAISQLRPPEAMDDKSAIHQGNREIARSHREEVKSPRASHAATQRPAQVGETPALKAGARKMLTILAQWHPQARTKDQLGALAGFSPSGGTFSDYLSKLRLAGFISENGNGIHITDEGIASVGQVPELPSSTDELLAMWRPKFKAGVGKMLDVLVEDYPGYITREELGDRAGYAASGGTFSDYLSQLRRARLIQESGNTVSAAESLFP
jgi:hypothetical protein